METMIWSLIEVGLIGLMACSAGIAAISLFGIALVFYDDRRKS